MIKGVDPEGRYNMAPFTWERGAEGTRKLLIDGLFVRLEGSMYDEEEEEWVPAGLFELKPTACTFDLKADNVDIRTSAYGRRDTPGTVIMCGSETPRDRYRCGNPPRPEP